MFEKRSGVKGSHACSRCGDALEDEASFCGCGKPSPTMSFAERNAYEAKQWRAYKARSSH